jgi:protein SCO1/2
MKVIVTILIVIAALAAVGLGVRLWLAKPDGGPVVPPLAMVPDFHLLDQTGAEFSRADLAGDVWVAAFIFTRCGGQCPMMMGSLKALQDWVKSEKSMRLVSFTVDPVHDTPEVLARYAREIGADSTCWTFVTGERDSLFRLANDGFLLGVSEPAVPDSIEPIAHSASLVLVDASGRIRGYYKGLDLTETTRLKADARRLLAAEGS